MSSFRGQNLFGSGPHRFNRGRQKQFVVPLWVVNGSPTVDGTGTFLIGDAELVVFVHGRLTGLTEAQLWSKRQDVWNETKFASSTKKGTLLDNDDRAWLNMVLVEYEEHGPIDRGRKWSVRYTATFRAITNTT